MWYALFVLCCALPVQGDLKVLLEPAVYPAETDSVEIELSYEIPFTSLAFVRDSNGFAAQYRIGLQAFDSRGNVLAGDIWEKKVTVPDYDRTIARDSLAAGVFRLKATAAVTDARVDIADLASDRRAWAVFKIAAPARGLLLRLLKSDRLFPARKYGISDTLEAVAVILAPGPAAHADSCQFRILLAGRAVAGLTVPDVDSSGRRTARFAYPIADSQGVPRLGGAGYELEATVGTGLTRLSNRVSFRVDVPFYLDDAAWVEKVDRLLYVATNQEMSRLRATPRPERKQAWDDFWKPKDKTPTTEQVEQESEYFERIAYAEEHFGHGDRGYRSDRARVYVRYGPPDQIESRPFEIDSPAYETCYYYQSNLRFVFVDRFGAGEYRLQNPEVLNDR